MEQDQGVQQEAASVKELGASRRRVLQDFVNGDMFADPESAPFRSKLRFLSSVRDAFEAELASQLSDAVTERLATMPQRTFRERKDAADLINGAAHQLRLASRCPKTGKACMIELHTTGTGRDAGVLYAKHLADPSLGVDPVIGDEIRSVQFVKLPATAAFAGVARATESRSR